MGVTLYGVAIAGVAAAAFRIHGLARDAAAPVVLSVCISVASLFYLSSLLPGAAAALGPVSVSATLIFLALLTYWKCGRARPVFVSAIGRGASFSREGDTLAAILLPTVPALLYYAVRVYRPWTGTRGPLAWDTVSYHLPGFIEFYQNRSLYSLEGPYQTYGFGFDLIANFPAYFFQHHLGLFIAHGFAIVFFFGALAVVTRNVMELVGLRRARNITLPYLVAASLLVVIFRGSFFVGVGKNDLFQTACILAFLGLLLELRRSDGGAAPLVRFRLLLCLAGLALALAISTKPTALAYAPLLPFVVVSFSLWSPSPVTLRQAAVSSVVVLLVATGIGGFFLVRNVAMIGALTDVAGADGWRLSILANLANPAMYELKRPSLIFAVSMFTPMVLWVLSRGNGPEKQLLRFQIVLFSLTSLAAFVVSPFVIIDVESANRWEFRQGITHFAWMAVALGGSVTALADRLLVGRLANAYQWLEDYVSYTLTRTDGVVVRGMHATFVVLVLGAAVAPVWWVPPRGLPYFDRVRATPRTTVYEWVQAIGRPTRIYAAGLRPYGLYGPGWENRVFYDLHSSILRDESAGMARVAAVVIQFQPELVLISIDPNQETYSPEKPLVDRLTRETECFEPVFEDATVSAFRVKQGCDRKLKAYAGEERVRMGA